MEKILLVDDELNIINAFKRRLADNYEFFSATSGAAALEILQTNPKISVIVSDMNMPGMSGSSFLSEASKKSPHAVRVMLTGLGDQRTAVRAINEGSVFRFLTKPCSVEDFEKTLLDCVNQHRLQQQERDMMQNTVGGVISLISDLLSCLDQEGVQLASNMRRVFREVFLKSPVSLVELELAATLSGLGKFSLPLEVLLKIGQGDELLPTEQHLCDLSIDTSARLLRHIPRFEKVSQLLSLVRAKELPTEGLMRSTVVAYRISEKIARGALQNEAPVTTLNRIVKELTPVEIEFVSAHLTGFLTPTAIGSSEDRFNIEIRDLCPGQRLMEDVKDKNGKLLLKKGFSISEAVIERIRNHDALVGIITPIIVNGRLPVGIN